MVWKIGMGAERGTVENVKKRETEKERKVGIVIE